MGFWQMIKKNWQKSDHISAAVGSRVGRHDQNIEHSRGGMATIGIPAGTDPFSATMSMHGGTNPTIQRASQLEERASQQAAEFPGVGPDAESAHTGDALEKDLDEHLPNIHKWSEEDKEI